MLLAKLAEKIVNEVRKLIGEDIIVVNTDGTIIASTDRTRIGMFHEGALIVSKEKRKLIITKGGEQNLKGVKAGISFPIFFQNNVIGVIGITGEPLRVTPFGEIIRKMTELLISENYYAEQFDRQSRAMETFVMDWIQTKDWDDSIINRARILEINIHLRRIIAIIDFESFDYIISRDAWTSMVKWFSPNPNDIVVRWGNERIVILLDFSNNPTKETINKKLEGFISFLRGQFGLSAFVGIGQAADSKEIRSSYRQAERALKVSKQKMKIIFDEELTLEMVLDELSPKTIHDFITRTIGPILTDKELIATLKELFKQNHSLKKTSDQLHIHINTLHYRLKKIDEYTQLNTGNIHDLLIMYLAILFLDVHTKISG
ncbi:sugar diacid recognition domain-containing protein [Neobacillus sp. PS3-40]|uniref:CdaR family transcriptional regulator n=1 Tax=Neobacillus sp. PS3-40 TaxID=3070679 RepID=UPI0027DFB2E4|nr:sugar diacid recognition domain-containing protein [Neobacillus sp. PS3-40]WML43485.1 sugar diacid recognition domain-containing protein [Neobacillus sp. PS3-40]